MLPGEFIPFQEVELHAKVAGYIRHIYVDIGDKVKTGQVLATLDIPELTAQVQGADAGVRQTQEQITRAKSEVLRAQANYAAMHSAAQRLQQASDARPGLIAQQELDDALARDRGAAAQVDSAKSALSAMEQQLGVSRADQQHYSSLADYSRITAPFSGVITWRYADTGSLIQAGHVERQFDAGGEAGAGQRAAAAGSGAGVACRIRSRWRYGDHSRSGDRREVYRAR